MKQNPEAFGFPADEVPAPVESVALQHIDQRRVIINALREEGVVVRELANNEIEIDMKRASPAGLDLVNLLIGGDDWEAEFE